MGEDEKDPLPEFELIAEATGLDFDQLEALKKGFDGFDKVRAMPGQKITL